MVEIILPAIECRLSHGATITGYAVSEDHPGSRGIVQCDPVILLRVYEGYGKMRAESTPAPRKGFGTLIGQAEISTAQISKGSRLWLRVVD